jgi:UDP-glucose 4-epimerase
MIKKIKANYLLVTGGAGYIGSKVCNDLIDQGYKVVVIDDLSTGNKLLVNKKAKFFKIDIKDKNKISNEGSDSLAEVLAECPNITCSRCI